MGVDTVRAHSLRIVDAVRGLNSVCYLFPSCGYWWVCFINSSYSVIPELCLSIYDSISALAVEPF